MLPYFMGGWDKVYKKRSHSSQVEMNFLKRRTMKKGVAALAAVAKGVRDREAG